MKFPDEKSAAHSARWDPARVLVECDAKRLLAQRMQRRLPSGDPDLSVPTLQLAHAFEGATRYGERRPPLAG